MKALIVTFTMIAFITLTSYKQGNNVDQLLKDQNTKEEVFNEILNNHELMIDFMNAMHGNQQAMMMCSQNYRHMQNTRTDTINNNSMMGGYDGNQTMGSANTNNRDNFSMEYRQMMNEMMNNPKLMRGFMTKIMNAYGQDSTFVNNLAKVMVSHPKLLNRAMHSYNHNNNMGMNSSHIRNGMHHMHN